MIKKVFIMIKGLPGSGKSTWADNVIKADPAGSAVRVNMDTFRSMLHCDRFSGRKTENSVLALRDASLERLMFMGIPTVICDDTNLNPKCEVTFRLLCEEYDYAFDVEDMTDIPIQTCIERDLKRPRSVGSKVIQRMYDQYLTPVPDGAPFTEGAPVAIIVDIDGTLAHMDGKRRPFDWGKVGGDRLDEAVANLVNLEASIGTKILIVSGRDGGCYVATKQWLDDKLVPHELLLMRPAGDSRKDSIIKREIFDEHIRGNYNVKYVLDDRDQVVEGWRQMGLKCFQVAPGAF